MTTTEIFYFQPENIKGDHYYVPSKSLIIVHTYEDVRIVDVPGSKLLTSAHTEYEDMDRDASKDIFKYDTETLEKLIGTIQRKTTLQRAAIKSSRELATALNRHGYEFKKK